MKYIDADKLSEKLKHYLDIQPATDGLPGKYSYEARGVKQAIDYALSLIKDSQQEQPEGLHFTPLNRLIQKIPSENWNDTVNNYAKKLCDCLIKEGYLKDADVLQGYISYMNGNNVTMATMDEQEQPEGLDEAAEKYESGLQNPDYQDSGYTDNDMIDAFKAGAEWMAGQGVTCGGRIMKSSMGETYAESDYVPLDGKCGDKVIVQIRKK